MSDSEERLTTRLSKFILGSPGLFSGVIRCLIRDHYGRKAGYSDTTRFEALRVLKVPTVHTPIFFAVRTFRSSEYGDRDSISPDEILKIVPPLELAAMLAVYYLYRRSRKLCDAEEWPIISHYITEQSEIGGHFGRAISDVGIGSGLMIGALRPYAMMAFSILNLPAFKNYRRALKISRTLYDSRSEEKAFSCTHPEVGASFLQRLGFGLNIARAFNDALTGSYHKDDEFVAGDRVRFQVAAEWINSLILNSTPPPKTSKTASSDEIAIASLMEQVKKAKGRKREDSWLEKTRKDYPKQEDLQRLNSPNKDSAYFWRRKT